MPSARRGPIVAVMTCALGTSTRALAYRPFDGTDADVAALHEVELELGPAGYLRTHGTSNYTPSFVFNLGFVARWELVVQGFGVLGGAGPAFTNGGVFVKHVLREGTLQEKSGLSLATEFGVLLPNVTSAASSDAGMSAALIASYAWRVLTLHVNVQLERAGDGAPDLFVGAILEGLPHARVRPVAELFVERHGNDTTPSVLVGAIWRLGEHLSVDGATRLADTLGAATLEVRAGLTWSF